VATVFGKRLREARERRGVSQRQLGILAGIHEDSASPRINQYETGRHTPNLLTAERLAKALQVPPPYLYARDDELASWILRYQGATSARRMSLREGKRRRG
jgi:transcriptional regulator with XRE-family HTH domain